MKYQELIIYDYLHKMFEYALNNDVLIYLDYGDIVDNDDGYYDTKRDFKKATEICNNGHVNFKDFNVKKEPKHYSTFPVNYINDTFDVDATELRFEIKQFDIINDRDDNIDYCCNCKEPNIPGLSFNGLVHNSGLNGEEPVFFEGGIKASYYMSRCKCDGDNKDTECKTYDDFPFYEFICYSENLEYSLTKHYSLINLFYYEK